MAETATTVEAYLDALPPERRDMVEAIRDAVLAKLPPGYVETMQYGMIGYVVPLERYPETYNGQPLAVASIANQKRYVAAYLHGCYLDQAARSWLEAAVRERSGKVDMGKSCVRFRKPEDLPADVIGEAVGKLDVDAFIDLYEGSRG